MAEPYLGQIALFSFGRAPKNYMLCNGQSMQISLYQALFSLLGTKFGGDGVKTFNLPNLQGRAVMGGAIVNNNVSNMGQNGGEAQHTLTVAETPPHMHTLTADSTTLASNNVTSPQGNALGQSQGTNPAVFPLSVYTRSGPTSGSKLAIEAIQTTGGQSHENMMPFLGLNYCIAVVGVYPTRN